MELVVSKELDRKIFVQQKSIDDLCKLDVDMLVNPTDAVLTTSPSEKLSHAIWNRAGEASQREINKIRESGFERMNTGQITSTKTSPSFKAKCVYHVPLRPEKSRRGLERKTADVNAAMRHILHTARDEKVKSIAIPPLGRNEPLVETFVQRLAKFFREEIPEDMFPFHVYLIAYDDDDSLFSLYNEELEKHDFMEFPLSMVKKEEWPSPQLRKELLNLHSGRLDHDPPLDNAFLLEQEDAFPLATQFHPEISLQGIHLKEEQESIAWGGMLYRVLVDEKDPKKANRAVIQYLYIWTKQPWFVSFWLNVVPLWILVFFSIYINSDIVFYNPLAEGATDITSELTAVTFLSVLMLDDRVFLISVISACFIILGVLMIISRRSIYIHSLFLIGFGILFSLQLVEFVYQSLPPVDVLLQTSLNVDIPFLSPETDVQTQVLWIPFILLLLSFAFLFVFVVQPPIPYIESRHQMDYAPVYVYLTRGNKLRSWALDYVLYDKDHYFIEDIDKTDLEKKSLLDADGEKPRLIMNTSWHSMFTSRTYWSLSNKLSGVFLIIAIWFVFISIFLLLISPELSIWLVGFLQARPLIILKRFLLPMLFFFLFLLITVFQPSKFQKEELDHKSSYLTDDKLRILWNLHSKPFIGPKTDQAQLKIRTKLQQPFVPRDDKQYWETFYDTGTEDIWVKFFRKFGYKSMLILISIVIFLQFIWLCSL